MHEVTEREETKCLSTGNWDNGGVYVLQKCRKINGGIFEKFKSLFEHLSIPTLQLIGQERGERESVEAK